jgi:integrase
MNLFDADLLAFKDDWKLADQAERTVDEYIRCLRKYHEWCSARKLQALTMRAAKPYLVELREHSVSNAYMCSRAIKAFSRWWSKEYSHEDPMAKLDYVKLPPTPPQRTATVEQMEAMAAVCGLDFIGLRDRAIILFFKTTCMRREEVASVTWGDIDLASGWVTLPRTKNREPRVARLDKEAQRALRRYWNALEDWEFKNRRDPIERVWVSTSRRCGLTGNGIGQMLHRRAIQAGLDLTAHAFRRGFAVEWLRRGGSETYLRKIAGWKSPRMVGVYVAMVEQEQALNEHERLFG